MERLLKDAQAISGVEYNIDNLGDVYDAIHVIQGELKLTGVAANEASTTLTGSAGAMKAAWHDLLGNMGLGEDIEPSLENLAETASVWLFDNFIPLIANVVKEIPKMIYIFLKTGIPILFDHGKELVQSAIKGIKNALPGMKSAGKEMVSGLWEGIKNAKDWLKNKIKSWVGDVVKFLKNLFGIHSPSTVMENEIGEFLPEGAAVGVDKNAKTLYSSIDAMSKEATRRLNIGANINASYGFNRKSKVSANKDMSNNLTGIRTDISKLEKAIYNMKVVMSNGAVVGAIASDMDDALGARQTLRKRGVLA